MVIATVTPSGPISNSKPGQKITTSDQALISSTAIGYYGNVPRNTSSNFDYSKENNFDNPEYYGQTTPPKETAREVLARRDQSTIPYSPPDSTIKPVNRSVSLNENVNIEATDPEQVNAKYSKGTTDFNTETAQTIEKLNEAKAAGINKLNIYDKNGNLVGSTNPQDVTRARYDMLKLAIKYGPVSAKYDVTSSSTQTTSTLVTQNYKEDLFSLVARPILAFGATVGTPLIDIIKTGKIPESPLQAFIEGKASNPLEPVFSPGVQEKIENTFGTSQEVSKAAANQYKGSQEAAALTGIVISVAIPIIAGASAMGVKNPISNKIAYIKAQINAQKVVKAYQRSENNLVTSTLEKTGNVYVMAKGTASKSGISSFIPTEVPPEQYFINRLPGGKVEVIKPGLLVKPTTEVTGIGKIGEKTIEHVPTDKELADRYPLFGQGKNDVSDLTKGEPYKQPPATESKPEFGKITIVKPNEITLTTKEGESKIPFAAINLAEGKVSIVTNEPSNVLGINNVRLTIEGSSEKEAAFYGEYYGGKPVPGMKYTFDIPITLENRESIERLAEGLQGNVLKQGTNIFEFSLEDISKNPDLYLNLTKNPKLFKSENLKGMDIIVQKVTRTMVGRGIAKENLKLNQEGRSKREFTPDDLLNLGEKVGAGAAGKAESLLRESTPNKSNKTILKEKQQSQSTNIFDYTTGTASGSSEGLFFETLAYPPIAKKESSLGLITESNQAIKNKSDIIEESGLNHLSKSSTNLINKLKGKQETNLNTDTVSKIDLLTNTSQVQESSLITSTKQTTDQLIKTEEVPVNPPRTKEETGIPLIVDNSIVKKLLGKKGKKGENKNFLGNTSEFDIIGLYKRTEITYGNKKVLNLSRKDEKRFTKGQNRFVKESHTSVRKNTINYVLTEKKPTKKTKPNILKSTKTKLFGSGKSKQIKF